MREAASLINGDGHEYYRPQEENFASIAARQGQLRNAQIDPWQVCVLMADEDRASHRGCAPGGFVDRAAYLARAGEQA